MGKTFFWRACLSAGVSVGSACALAANVLVLSSDNANEDTAALNALTANGHTATLGPDLSNFDGSLSLVGYDVVLMLDNYNYNNPDMPLAGQNALVGFVSRGGGMVTTEWTVWSVARQTKFQVLYPILPCVTTQGYNSNTEYDLSLVVADPYIDAGLPATFTLPSDDLGGCESEIQAVKQGAAVFFNSVFGGTRVGLAGWSFDNGRVADFSQTVGAKMVSSPMGAKLVANTVTWASHGTTLKQIKPDTVTVRLGRVTKGGLAEMGDIDNNVFEVCKFLVPNQQVAPITVEVEGQSPLAGPVQMVFRTYSKMNASGAFGETLDLYDWQLGAFSPTAVRTDSLGVLFKAVSVFADGNVSRFVSGTGRVRARFRITLSGPSSSAEWCQDLDQATWFVN